MSPSNFSWNHDIPWPSGALVSGQSRRRTSKWRGPDWQAPLCTTWSRFTALLVFVPSVRYVRSQMQSAIFGRLKGTYLAGYRQNWLAQTTRKKEDPCWFLSRGWLQTGYASPVYRSGFEVPIYVVITCRNPLTIERLLNNIKQSQQFRGRNLLFYCIFPGVASCYHII